MLFVEFDGSSDVYCVRGLLADPTYYRCHGRRGYGVYIWTAGQRRLPYIMSPSRFQWKFDVRHGPYPERLVVSHEMNWFNWDGRQPDFGGGGEDCINLWPDRDYRWNDEDCGYPYCFVCENRNARWRLVGDLWNDGPRRQSNKTCDFPQSLLDETIN